MLSHWHLRVLDNEKVDMDIVARRGRLPGVAKPLLAHRTDTVRLPRSDRRQQVPGPRQSTKWATVSTRLLCP